MRNEVQWNPGTWTARQGCMGFTYLSLAPVQGLRLWLLKWLQVLFPAFRFISTDFLYRNGEEDRNRTLTAFHDGISVFIGRVSLTDGYPVSARILPPLSPVPSGGGHSSIISVPSLEHFVKKTDFSKIITESCF